jgi:hypothetical protein
MKRSTLVIIEPNAIAILLQDTFPTGIVIV